MKITENVHLVQPPPITEVKRWVAGKTYPADKPLIDLCQAIPSYAPPQGLIDHLQKELTDPLTFKYSLDEGLPDVRADVSSWYRRHYGNAPKSDQMCLTIGASQAFWLAMMSLCQAGDEVIIQLPAYFDHIMGIQSLGIKAVYAPFHPENNGQPDIEELARLITPRTKALLLVTPSNPTGTVLSSALIDRLFELAKAHDIALVLDETYNAFVGTLPHNLFSRPDWSEHFIQLASFGKTFALTGLRCGALIADQDFIDQGALKLQDSMVVCQSRPAQLALQYGCRNLDEWIAANSLMMQQRHDSFKKQFESADLAFELAVSGSFFAWIKHPWTQWTGREAARKLAEEDNLICLPGEAFGPGLENYLRLAFGNVATEQISDIICRFESVRIDR